MVGFNINDCGISEKDVLSKVSEYYNLEGVDNFYDLFDNIEDDIDFVDDSKIGYIIASWDDEGGGLDDFSISMDTVQDKVQALTDMLKDTGINAEVRLFGGFEAC
jgi:hypothetical protein